MHYTGPKCRLCRREGIKLFLKGERCFSPKCPIERRGAVAPGAHGIRRQGKLSDYGVQLREKQKMKRLFGLTEKQLNTYYRKAAKERAATGEALMRQLELRLDNVVFRAGFTPSRSVARQLVNHGHVLVDGKKIDIASYQLKPEQVVSLGSKGLALEPVKKMLSGKAKAAAWLAKKAAVAKVMRLPQREEMESSVNEQLIVEFYSR